MYGWKGGDPGDASLIDWRDEVQIEPTEQEYTDGWVLAQAETASKQSETNRRETAKLALVALGADGARVQGVPDLAETLAQVIEAQGLDIPTGQ